MLDERFAIMWGEVISNIALVLGMLGLVIYSFPYLGLLFIPFIITAVSGISAVLQTSL
jgi:hypothetical protein